jgi:hypothetical protein
MMRRVPRTVMSAACLALGLLLAGCENFDLDKLDIFGLNQKKKLPGVRVPVFPNGVPGVTQGIPPEYMQGYQPPTDSAQVDNPLGATATDTASGQPANGQAKPSNLAEHNAEKRTAAIEPVEKRRIDKRAAVIEPVEKPKANAKPKRKRRTAARPAQITVKPVPQGKAASKSGSPWPTQQEKPKEPWPSQHPQQAQSPWPAQPQQPQSSWPAQEQKQNLEPWPSAPPSGTVTH